MRICAFGELSDFYATNSRSCADKILESARYLSRFVKGISICKTDCRANNGGCTEPHVSHILSSRLSSRPMTWSRKTLKKLARFWLPVILHLGAKIQKNNKALRSRSEREQGFPQGALDCPVPTQLAHFPLQAKLPVHKNLEAILLNLLLAIKIL